MNIKRYSLMAVAAIGLSLPASGFALAQETAPAAPAPEMQQQAPAQDFSDEQLRSFAVAFLEVDQINKQYTPRLQEAGTPEEQQAIQEEASQEMVSAVESSEGISVQEYTSIMQAAQADPALAQTLTEYIGEASGGETTPAE
ncbi:DUF4168 domain-containing protein [Pararhizobium haloflavum]|uniref:DUF4168 domain-containing protein n=1 Tax=Pararhizobium haloflavum TaxID=2037914 RepID=UPI000C18D032|nr:DUF4168 domain-containing protein [Pararhizobium haloflavum]